MSGPAKPSETDDFTRVADKRGNETKSVVSDGTKIVVIGADKVVLERLQAQVQLRGLPGRVELIVGDEYSLAHRRTPKPNLIIW